MNRKMLVIFGLSLVLVACGLITQNEDDGNKTERVHAGGNNDPLPLVGNPKEQPKPPELPGKKPANSKAKPVTQYDTQALDDKVRTEAKRMGKDPNTYRMLVRTDPDGTKIYRMIGMHVIVNPNKEEVFLPDEI